MARHVMLQFLCRVCQGTGTRITQLYDAGGNPSGTTESVCSSCKGEKMDLSKSAVLPIDHYSTHQLYQCIKKSEMSEATDNQKDILRMIMSMGIVWLGAESEERSDLISIFGPGTDTRAALITLIGE